MFSFETHRDENNMADINPTGSLLVGEGVFMKGTMRVPGTASIDGKMEGELSADTVFIQPNGAMDGLTTANHVRVAGSLTNTTVANKTLVIESSGVIAGSITYEELEIKKGGSLQGGIYKVGEAPAAVKPSKSGAVAAPVAEPAAEASATPDQPPA
jgi:cytoskeletal protein CcmA (bactofilin family)